MTGYTIDSSAFGDKQGMPFQLTGLKEAKGVIDFSVGDKPYQLAFGKMMLIEKEGGWFGADFTQLARKGESLEPDKEETEAEAADEAPRQKPAVKQQKAAAGKPKAPVKKAKAPAKKKATS